LHAKGKKDVGTANKVPISPTRLTAFKPTSVQRHSPFQKSCVACHTFLLSQTNNNWP